MPIYALNGKQPIIASSAFVHPEAIIIGEATIGDECLIAPGAVIRADFGPVIIGEKTIIQDNAVIHVTRGRAVIIGDKVIVGHCAILHDVELQERCVIGMGAILLPNTYCGAGLIVAAGSVVLQGTSILTRKLVAGNPARVIKDVTPEQDEYAEAGLKEYKNLIMLYRRTMEQISV